VHFFVFKSVTMCSFLLRVYWTITVDRIKWQWIQSSFNLCGR